jgi:serine/threonine-protein kinase
VSAPQIVGRYALYEPIASGGMATVHYGRLLGPVGFSRTVAIKRLHAQYARDPEFVAMFLDEARLAAHVRHPNVVGTLDVVAKEDEVFVVMEYVHGESLARLARVAAERGERVPPAVASAVVVGLLDGLQAAHDAVDEAGQPLGIVHRDVSPGNVLVGTDGLARVADFGIAKARRRIQTTREGQLKGKLSYMPPEQIRGRASPRSDLYAAAVVLWELLAGRRLFEGDEAEILCAVLTGEIEPPGRWAPALPVALDALVMRGLDKDPERRFASATEMARAVEKALPPAAAREVGAWVGSLASATLAEREAAVTRIEERPTAAPHTPVEPIADPETEPLVDPESAPLAPAEPPPGRTRARWLVAVAALGLAIGGWLLARAPGATRPATAAFEEATAPEATSPRPLSEDGRTAPPTESAPPEPRAQASAAVQPAASPTAEAVSTSPRRAARAAPSAKPTLERVLDSRK